MSLATVKLANTSAGRVALMAGAADVVVSDWLFVAAQRAAGTPLCFAPFSTATGGVVVRGGSPIRSFADLKGRRLGIAGGPVDKSWLILQAAAHARGIDLAATARVVYGAPPLLGAKLEQGELDAVLTYWNFVARLEAAGGREVIPVAACAASSASRRGSAWWASCSISAGRTPIDRRSTGSLARPAPPNARSPPRRRNGTASVR